MAPARGDAVRWLRALAWLLAFGVLICSACRDDLPQTSGGGAGGEAGSGGPECSNDVDCALFPQRPLCELNLGRCVACRSDRDCTGGRCIELSCLAAGGAGGTAGSDGGAGAGGNAGAGGSAGGAGGRPLPGCLPWALTCVRDPECNNWVDVAPAQREDPRGARVASVTQEVNMGFAMFAGGVAQQSDDGEVRLHRYPSESRGPQERRLEPTRALMSTIIAGEDAWVVSDASDCDTLPCEVVLMLHDLANCTTMELIRAQGSSQDALWYSPNLADGRFYFTQGFGRSRTVEIDLRTGARREFFSASSAGENEVRAIAVKDGWLAMVEARPPDRLQYDLRVENLSTGESRWVTDSAAKEWTPQIANGKLYWSDATRGVVEFLHEDEHDIYSYDLATGVTKPVVTARGSQIVMSAEGDELMWIDFRDGYWGVENSMGAVDIYWGNVVTGEERRLTLAPRAFLDLKRFGDRYGWTENGAAPGAPHDYRVWTAPLPSR